MMEFNPFFNPNTASPTFDDNDDSIICRNEDNDWENAKAICFKTPVDCLDKLESSTDARQVAETTENNWNENDQDKIRKSVRFRSPLVSIENVQNSSEFIEKEDLASSRMEFNPFFNPNTASPTFDDNYDSIICRNEDKHNETEANNIFERSQEEPKKKRKITHNHEINMNENVEVDAEEDVMERTPPFPSSFESFKNSQDRPEFANINDEGPATNTDDILSDDMENEEDYEENEDWQQQEDEVKPRKLPKKKLNVEKQPTASDDGSKPPRKRNDPMMLLKGMGKQWKDEYFPTLIAKTEAALLEVDKFDEKRKKVFKEIRQERNQIREHCATVKKNIIDAAFNI